MYVFSARCSWIPWKLVFPQHFISWKTHYLILAGCDFYQIWLEWLTALITFGKIRFMLISENEFTREITRDGITSFHGIHVLHSSWSWSLRWETEREMLWHLKLSSTLSSSVGGRALANPNNTQQQNKAWQSSDIYNNQPQLGFSFVQM